MGIKVNENTFSETKGDYDSHRETFALWVVNTRPPPPPPPPPSRQKRGKRRSVWTADSRCKQI